MTTTIAKDAPELAPVGFALETRATLMLGVLLSARIKQIQAAMPATQRRRSPRRSARSSASLTRAC